MYEEVLVVDEIDLHSRDWNGCDLDDERVVGAVDDDVHSRQSYHLMQLSSAFVDVAPFRHECSYLASAALYGFRYSFTHDRQSVFCHVWCCLSIDEEDFLDLHINFR